MSNISPTTNEVEYLIVCVLLSEGNKCIQLQSMHIFKNCKCNSVSITYNMTI